MAGKPTRVLHVEDGPDIRRVTRFALGAPGGFTVEIGATDAIQKPFARWHCQAGCRLSGSVAITGPADLQARLKVMGELHRVAMQRDAPDQSGDGKSAFCYID